MTVTSLWQAHKILAEVHVITLPVVWLCDLLKMKLVWVSHFTASRYVKPTKPWINTTIVQVSFHTAKELMLKGMREMKKSREYDLLFPLLLNLTERWQSTIQGLLHLHLVYSKQKLIYTGKKTHQVE